MSETFEIDRIEGTVICFVGCRQRRDVGARFMRMHNPEPGGFLLLEDGLVVGYESPKDVHARTWYSEDENA